MGSFHRRVHTSTAGLVGEVVLRVASSQRRQLERVGCIDRLVVLQNHTQCFARHLRTIDVGRMRAGCTHVGYRVDRCFSISGDASSVCGRLRVGGEGSALTDGILLQTEYHHGYTNDDHW